MSEQSIDPNRPADDVHRCEADLETHAAKILLGTRLTGTGLGCYTAYEALVELADAVRRTHNWPAYESKGIIYKKMQDAEVEANINAALIPGQKMGQA